MIDEHRRRRGRTLWRSRRLALLVVAAVDVAGAAALTYALTSRTSNRSAGSGHALGSKTPRVRSPSIHRAAQPQTQDASRHSVRRTYPRANMPANLQARFRAFASSEPGTLGLALAPLGEGPTVSLGALQVGHAWSTMKVPVLVTLLSWLEAHGDHLDAPGQADAELALEQSDNVAAEALFARLEAADGGLNGASSAVQLTLRRAGDKATNVNTAPNNEGFTTWGQTEWTASGEVTFYRSLVRGCLLARADTAAVLQLMRNVESAQRWGAGTMHVARELPVEFKGGWGPEHGSGYLVRQSAIVGSGNRGWVFSILARPFDGSFASGARIVSDTAQWIGRTLPLGAQTASANCS